MSIQEKIRHFIVTNFFVANPAQLGDETSLLDAGVIDSTGVLEIIAFLQANFAIQVEDDEIIPENLDGVSRLVRYVERKQATKEAQPA